MNDMTIILLAVGLGVIIVVGFARMLDRQYEAEARTGRSSRLVRILATLLGIISGGFFVFGLLYSQSVGFLWLVAAIVLIGYGLGGVGFSKGREADLSRNMALPKIQGIEGLTSDELVLETQTGGRFVVFQYCISIVILTFKQSSDIYFVKANESATSKGIGFILLSLLLGWWGIPWGPVYTIQAVITNLKGGKDVTKEVIASLNPSYFGFDSGELPTLRDC